MALNEHLSVLEATGLIRLARIEPDLEYLFRHGLLQEAAYQSLLKAERRELHQAVGETLERLADRRPAESAATLAHHFERADAHSQALRYFELAGDRARAAYANAEAIGLYRAAIEQARRLWPSGAAPAGEGQARLAKLHETLGDVLDLAARLDEAREVYASAAACLPPDDMISAGRLQRKIGRAWAYQFRHAEAAAAYDRAEQALGPGPGEPAAAWWREWLNIQLDRITSLYWQGQWREVERLVEQTRPVLAEHGTPALRFQFYDGLISVAERRDRYVISEEVLQHARAMLEAGRESGELRLLSEGHFQLGFCLLVHGDLDEAGEHLQTAEDLMRRTGNANFLAYVLTYRSMLYRRRGQPDQARPYIQAAHAATRENNIVPHLAVAEGNLAWLYLLEGDLDGTLRHGRAAADLWPKSTFAYPFWWTAYLPLLAVALEREQLAEAIGCARALLDPTQQRLPDSIDRPLAQASGLFEQGQTGMARSALAQAVSAARQLHYL